MDSVRQFLENITNRRLEPNEQQELESALIELVRNIDFGNLKMVNLRKYDSKL